MGFFCECFVALAVVGLGVVAIFIVVVVFLAEAAYRAAATRFLLLRQKKPGKEKTTLAAGLSGETPCAPASLRSNSRRKYEASTNGARRLRARGLWQVERTGLETAIDSGH